MAEAPVRLRSTDLTWERLDDDVVVLDLAGSTYLRLNGPGAQLWEQLVLGADQQQLVDHLLLAYDVDEPTAERDVAAFLARLRDAGLLQRPRHRRFPLPRRRRT